jgi:hypothetical protein
MVCCRKGKVGSVFVSESMCWFVHALLDSFGWGVGFFGQLMFIRRGFKRRSLGWIRLMVEPNTLLSIHKKLRQGTMVHPMKLSGCSWHFVNTLNVRSNGVQGRGGKGKGTVAQGAKKLISLSEALYFIRLISISCTLLFFLIIEHFFFQHCSSIAFSLDREVGFNINDESTLFYNCFYILKLGQY